MIQMAYLQLRSNPDPEVTAWWILLRAACIRLWHEQVHFCYGKSLRIRDLSDTEAQPRFTLTNVVRGGNEEESLLSFFTGKLCRERKDYCYYFRNQLMKATCLYGVNCKDRWDINAREDNFVSICPDSEVSPDLLMNTFYDQLFNKPYYLYLGSSLGRISGRLWERGGNTLDEATSLNLLNDFNTAFSLVQFITVIKDFPKH